MKHHTIPLPYLGLNTTIEPTRIPDNMFPCITGMWVRNGIIEDVPVALDEEVLPTITGTVLLVTEYLPLNGVPLLVVGTSTGLYTWRGGVWETLLTASVPSWDSTHYAGRICFAGFGVGIYGWDGENPLEQIVSWCSAKFITTYQERLVLAKTIEYGYDQAQRVRWNKPGQYNVWEEVDFADLIDDPTPIMSVVKVGDEPVIFKQNSTLVMRDFAFYTILHAMGAYTAIAWENKAFFYNKLGVFLFDGSRWPEEISVPVKKNLQGTFNENTKLVLWTKYDHLLLITPQLSLGYNFKEKAWSKLGFETIPNVIFPDWEQSSGTRWSDLQVLETKWSDYPSTRWSELYTKTTGVGFVASGSSFKKLGYNKIDRSLLLDTKRFPMAEYGVQKCRFLWLDFECLRNGGTLTVRITKEREEGWKKIREISGLITGKWETRKLPVDLLGEYFQITFHLDITDIVDPDFPALQLRNFGFYYLPREEIM